MNKNVLKPIYIPYIYVTLCDEVKMKINVTDTGKLVTIHFKVLIHYTII
jgi:hypothetical protein